MRRFAIALLLMAAGRASAQHLDPVKWSLSVEPVSAAPGSKIVAHLHAAIEPGWHLYGLSTPPPSRPTHVQLTGTAIGESVTIYAPEPKRAFDPNFNIETQTYERAV